MAKAPGPFTKAWYEWKMLRFPWRKRWLVGFDLQGNTFWEFKDALHSLRNRRIAKYARSTHYGDVNVSPGWMQWLRHTRFEPPSLAEQQADVQRQLNIKMLAARADERWAAKPSALDAPDKQQPMPVLESRDPKSGLVHPNPDQHLPSPTPPSRDDGQPKPLTPPSASRDEWQPKPWTPPPRKRG